MTQRIFYSLALVAVLGALSLSAKAQTLVNCAPNTPCVYGTGPYNTGTGDSAANAFGKINADLITLTSGQALRAVISGSPTAGDCVKWISATTIGDFGSACGSGGGGAPAVSPTSLARASR